MGAGAAALACRQSLTGGPSAPGRGAAGPSRGGRSGAPAGSQSCTASIPCSSCSSWKASSILVAILSVWNRRQAKRRQACDAVGPCTLAGSDRWEVVARRKPSFQNWAASERGGGLLRQLPSTRAAGARVLRSGDRVPPRLVVSIISTNRKEKPGADHAATCGLLAKPLPPYQQAIGGCQLLTAGSRVAGRCRSPHQSP